MSAPWTFDEAQAACREASTLQLGAERALVEAAKAAAIAEEAYRIALAKEIVRQHGAEGVAWTVAPDIARGDKDVARLRRERDIAQGVQEATGQAAWRRTADRKDTQRFCDWSMRRELAEGAGHAPEPADHTPFGRVAA